jgi:hypothetical protein
MDRFTVPLFFVAFALGLAAMPCDVYAFNQRGLGVDHAVPWKNRCAAAVDQVTDGLRAIRTELTRFWSNEKGEAATDLLLPVPTSISARLRGLREEKAALIKESQDILNRAATENRTITAEEIAVDDKIHKRLDTVMAEVQRYDRVLEADRRVITDTSSGGSDAPTVGPIKSFGQFLQAVAAASSPSVAALIPNGRELVERLHAYNAASGMSVGVPGDGGYLVRKDWTTALLAKARTDAVLLPRCKSIDIGATSMASSIRTSTNRAASTARGGAASRSSGARKQPASRRSSRRSAKASSGSRR